MAYLKKQDLVVLKGKVGQTTAIVTDIEFRRFKRTYKDKKTGEMKSRLKSVPYAICNHALKGEKCLVLESQYIPEYEDHGERWVVDMIEENRKKNAKKKKSS